MSSSTALPQKQDLPKEIWKIATTLSDDAQNAAIRKARELGFDLNKGRIPLEETFINLSGNRDVILDAVEKNKLVQLPLKLQYSLLAQTQKISDSLTAIVNGTDGLLSLEDSVDDLSSTIWQYNLHNLSDQVLGFHNKMNQIKAQETAIRRAHREAEDFEASNTRAHDLLKQIEEFAKAGSDQAKSVQSSAEQLSAAVAKSQELEQRIAGLAIQAQQHDSTAAQFAANAKTAAADVESIAAKSRALQTEIDSTKSQLTELTGRVEHVLSSTEKTINESLGDFGKRYDQLKDDAEKQATSAREKLNNSVQESLSASQSRIDSSLAAIQKTSLEQEASLTKLATDTSNRLAQSEATHESRLVAQINEFTQKSTAFVEELKAAHKLKVDEIAEKSDAAIAAGDREFKRLASELDELEGRIRESIERATGYSLFHSFQKRQLDLAKSKKFWGIALACAVGVSLLASAGFIYSLRYVQVYNAAFYLKLSISLPLIYAIAFCSLQYGRERRLEEEYAFKSAISISLDPYQKLIGQLVDQKKPEELAKHTAFVIDSVNRVFTSPTAAIFDDQSADKNSTEKVIKAVGDIIEPLAKAINIKK
jgi:hypothetical protein